MKITRVIPSRIWRHTTGRTASIYGAGPWGLGGDPAEWTMETVGWTWELANGTVGLGRVPAKTKEEAMEVMARINARYAKSGR